MDDQVTNTMGKESVSIETSDSAPLKSNKLMLKIKISKNLKSYGGGQHICPVCRKGFMSGKALGGHIRIHMKGSKKSCHRKISKRQPRNILHRAKSKKKISDMASPKAMDESRESNEKVSCCICNKDFKSMKSLFGHMRNHPERNWRGIRPPPSDKNSCCSTVSENDEALEVDQNKGSVSDLLKSLPKWTNIAKRCEKSTSDQDDEISEAAYCLMKLSRGDSFDLDHTKNPSSDRFMIDKSGSWGVANKASELKGKSKVKTEWELDWHTMKLNYADARIIKNNRLFGQFQKIPMKPDEEKIDPATTEGRYRGQRPGFYPKNPSGGLFETPLNETAVTPAADKGSQVCSPKTLLDFDLNEPYVEGLDGDA